MILAVSCEKMRNDGAEQEELAVVSGKKIKSITKSCQGSDTFFHEYKYNDFGVVESIVCDPENPEKYYSYSYNEEGIAEVSSCSNALIWKCIYSDDGYLKSYYNLKDNSDQYEVTWTDGAVKCIHVIPADVMDAEYDLLYEWKNGDVVSMSNTDSRLKYTPVYHYSYSRIINNFNVPFDDVFTDFVNGDPMFENVIRSEYLVSSITQQQKSSDQNIREIFEYTRNEDGDICRIHRIKSYDEPFITEEVTYMIEYYD